MRYSGIAGQLQIQKWNRQDKILEEQEKTQDRKGGENGHEKKNTLRKK